jgi:AbrB family looped-hinge helix DNA binding protein
MRVTIDRAGRVVVPKPVRDHLGIGPNALLDLEVVNGHVELSIPDEPGRIVHGRHGPVIEKTGATITDEQVRDALEAARERR